MKAQIDKSTRAPGLDEIHELYKLQQQQNLYKKNLFSP